METESHNSMGGTITLILNERAMKNETKETYSIVQKGHKKK